MTAKETSALDSVLGLVHKGKVRRTYVVKGRPDLLLLYATDQVSTHNVVHHSTIPQKGIVLTAMTIHWLREVFPDLKHHLVAAGREIYQYLPEPLETALPQLHHRAIIVRKLNVSPFEFIYRRHLVGAGSLYRAYQAKKDPYRLQLPEGLPVMHRFNPPLFTPTDKSETDDPRNYTEILTLCPKEVSVTRILFLRGEKYLAERGIALLDSKMEAAADTIADEMLTPDSSRFANISEVQVGQDPPWLDKEYLRAEAVEQWKRGAQIPLTFSSGVIAGTRERYGSILMRVTGYSMTNWVKKDLFDCTFDT